MITAARNAFTHYLAWINTLADMPRTFAVTSTILFAVGLLYVIVTGTGRVVRIVGGG